MQALPAKKTSINITEIEELAECLRFERRLEDEAVYGMSSTDCDAELQPTAGHKIVNPSPHACRPER
jgi:hypothetical protein